MLFLWKRVPDQTRRPASGVIHPDAFGNKITFSVSCLPWNTPDGLRTIMDKGPAPYGAGARGPANDKYATATPKRQRQKEIHASCSSG